MAPEGGPIKPLLSGVVRNGDMRTGGFGRKWREDSQPRRLCYINGLAAEAAAPPVHSRVSVALPAMAPKGPFDKLVLRQL